MRKFREAGIVLGLFCFVCVLANADAKAQTVYFDVQTIALKSGESAELADVYLHRPPHRDYPSRPATGPNSHHPRACDKSPCRGRCAGRSNGPDPRRIGNSCGLAAEHPGCISPLDATAQSIIIPGTDRFGRDGRAWGVLLEQDLRLPCGARHSCTSLSLAGLVRCTRSIGTACDGSRHRPIG